MRTLFLCCWLAAVAAVEPPAVEPVADLHGWPGYRLNNGLVTAGVSPTWGGRCLQFDLGGHPILWTDPATRGAVLEAGPAPDTHWKYINVGGFRCWPAPQSAWKRSDCGIGIWPPPPQLDHGHYVAHQAPGEITCHGPAEMHPLWRCTGLQFSYTYKLAAESTNFAVSCTATNVALYPQRWGVWDVTSVRSGPGVDIVWPLRRDGRSRFGEREWILEGGDDHDSQWSTDRAAGLVRVHCQDRSGKIAGDTDGGWIAVIDSRDGIAYVKRFAHDAAAWQAMRYPEGGSTVAVCVGPGWAEVEVMSPETDLDPGQKTTLATTWSACRLKGTVRSVNAAGIVSEPLTVTVANGRLHCTGSYGVFARGHVLLRMIGGAAIMTDREVTPLEPLLIDVDSAQANAGQGCELVLVQDGHETVLDRSNVP